MFLLVLLKTIKSDKSHNPNLHAHSLEQMRIITYIQGLFNINYRQSPLHCYYMQFNGIIFAAPLSKPNSVPLPCTPLYLAFEQEAKQVCVA